jgi:transcriptional regulator with XRE-family HTH domain
MGGKRDPACVQFGRNLRRLRSRAGLSQAELGKRLGVSYQQVQKYESGDHNVNVPAMCGMKALLGCEFADFFAGLDGGTGAAGEGADARQQRVVYRLSRAVLAIKSHEQRERLIHLAQAMAGRS